jgi:hypothetical protein
MPVKVLEAIHYPASGRTADGSGWEPLLTRDPTWAVIESAIRKLDRHEWPFLWLHTVEPVEWEMPENALNVMGGRGEYAISCYRDGDEMHYLDASRSDRAVRIWESDQGSVQAETNLCGDLARVLEIARHFAEAGELHPAVSWERW